MINDSWLGSSWRLFPPTTNNSLNLVSGVNLISSKLIHLLLLEPGEDPLHPELGFAPQLFTPKSNRSAQKFKEELITAIQQWNKIYPLGIRSLKLLTQDDPSTDRVTIILTFIPKTEYQEHSLSFQYYSELSVSEFLQTIRVDNAQLTNFT